VAARTPTINQMDITSQARTGGNGGAPQPNAAQTRACYNCDEVGHFTRECKKPPTPKQTTYNTHRRNDQAARGAHRYRGGNGRQYQPSGVNGIELGSGNDPAVPARYADSAPTAPAETCKGRNATGLQLHLPTRRTPRPTGPARASIPVPQPRP
jgi:hypothetical protein